MILKGTKKKLLKDVIKYYVETTNNVYEDFITKVSSANVMSEKDLPYDTWLAQQCFALLKANEISLADCIENKDTIHSAIKADKSRMEGEFYTPEVWCKEGRKYLKEMLGDLWGKAYIWDASCYDMATELLTKRGWLHYDDLRDDDLVYSLNPDTLKGEWVGLSRKFTRGVCEDLVHFESKDIDLLVTDDHSMFVQDMSNSEYKFMKAKELYSALSKGKSKYIVPCSAEAVGLKSATELDKEMQLIGLWLGCGTCLFSEEEMTGVSFLLHSKDLAYASDLFKAFGEEGAFIETSLNDCVEVTTNAQSIMDLCAKYLCKIHGVMKLSTEVDLTCYAEAIFEGIKHSAYFENNEDNEGLCCTSWNKNNVDVISEVASILGYSVTITTEYSDGPKKYKLYMKENKSYTLGEYNVSLEHYSGYVWDITLDKYHVFMVRRNGKVCFSGNCGTGNLLKTADYPQDKIFMSTLLEEDVPMVQQILPEATVFQLDFLNGIDEFGIVNDLSFSEKLPEKLQEVLRNNEPIVFYMNPPYKVMKSDSTELGVFMGNHCCTDYIPTVSGDDNSTTSLKKCALDIFHQFMFRMFLLKRDYNLTNMYMGIFGPITMFHSKMLEPLYRLYKNDFVFNGGMCFTAGDFANTSESVGWVVGYTTWRPKRDGDTDKPIVLTAKTADQEGNISVIGDRLITNIEENLHDWCKKDATEGSFNYTNVPICTSIFNFADSLGVDYDNAVGYMMSSNYVIRATRRACITSLPNTDSIPINTTNFWKCVGSYAARRCYATKVDPFNNCQYYNQPDVNIEGYNEWLIDAVVLLLFDYNSMQCAYRGMDVNGIQFEKANRLFPIRKEVLKDVITDPKIIEDMATHEAENQMIVDLLDKIVPQFSPEAKALYDWGVTYLVNSFVNGKREKANYDCCLQAWDASLAQLRVCKGVFTDSEEKEYSYLLSKLKDKLFDGIYKYGFMTDTALGFKVDSINMTEEV